jgi:hypothetical protein
MVRVWDEAATLGTDLLNRADPSPINRVSTLTELGLIRAAGPSQANGIISTGR